jgi:hypothetical protein
MSQEQSYAEKQFSEGKLYAVQCITGGNVITGQPLVANEKANFSQRAINLFEQALNYGLDGKNEIECRCFHGRF